MKNLINKEIIETLAKIKVEKPEVIRSAQHGLIYLCDSEEDKEVNEVFVLLESLLGCIEDESV